MDPCSEKCVFVGYGVTQKGYQCYNPKTRHMFITMNCDFLKTEYYYASHHSGQEERECDTLGWLRYTPYKGRSHNPRNEDPRNKDPHGKMRTYRKLKKIQAKMNMGKCKKTSNNLPHKKACQRNISSPKSKSGCSTEKVLLKKETRGCRYPVANIVKGKLSKEAKAFVSSLYYEDIPTSVEQALKSRHWKDAMEEEMKVLTKNNTWEKRILSP
ncbi:putative ribonuclease H-like domain-containing protein [Tanacetum coccineum]